QFFPDSSSHLICWKRWNAIVKLRKFFEVDVRNNIGADGENLRHLDEAGTERSDCCRQPSRALAMIVVGPQSWRTGKNPTAAVSKETDHEGKKTEPDDEDAEEHVVAAAGLARA